MRQPMTRRALLWTAIPLIAGQVGCAARGVQPPPPLAAPPAVTVPEANRRACETYADKQPSKSVMGRTLLGLLLAPIGAAIGVAGAAAGQPQGLLLPFMAFGPAADAARENRATRGRALDLCLAPVILAETLGPEHPDVAKSLAQLAGGYDRIGDVTQAGTLYQRALTIQERALGPEHPDVAPTLEAYAALLRKVHRAGEATDLETRAQTIRSTVEAARATDAVATGATRPEAADPGGPPPSAPPTSNPVE